MTIEEVEALWAEDSVIHYKDFEKLEGEILHGGQIISKYGMIGRMERSRNAKLELSKLRLQHQLEGYYEKGLYCDELATRDKVTGEMVPRKPHPYTPKTKAETAYMIATDPKMIKLNEQILESNEIILTCKAAIDYTQFRREQALTNHMNYLKHYEGKF